MGNYFSAETADELWLQLAKVVRSKGSSTELVGSRIGETIELPHTFFTIKNPKQRWILSRNPSINPAFSIAELVWIMNGRNDSKFLNYWNTRLPNYAGKGKKYYGAYGYRLRKNFGIDQIKYAYQTLKNNPESRQVVLQIWDPSLDLPKRNGIPRNADIPCNITSLIKVRNNRLDWTQILRSNDIFLGLPYNILQFTSIQEILAGWLKIEVGEYNQLSDSLHLYIKDSNDFSLSKVSASIKNTDSLSVGKKQSEKYFKDLAAKIEILINFNNSKTKIETVLSWNAPSAYKNLLYVLSAEAMRRRKNINEAIKIIQYCNNPVLTETWNNWLMRTSK